MLHLCHVMSAYIGLDVLSESAFAMVLDQSVRVVAQRRVANRRALPKYKKLLKYPPQGKSFREITNLKTLKPKPEGVQIYQKAKKELVEIGLLQK
mgnify:CR=1 FL=1